MELNDYQRESRKTALYPDVGRNAIYPTLGLVGEAGEVAEKLKKSIRDYSMFDKEGCLQELGDTLFYVAALANLYGGSLQTVAEMNVKKLDDRQLRGVLQGSGDNR